MYGLEVKVGEKSFCFPLETVAKVERYGHVDHPGFLILGGILGVESSTTPRYVVRLHTPSGELCVGVDKVNGVEWFDSEDAVSDRANLLYCGLAIKMVRGRSGSSIVLDVDRLHLIFRKELQISNAHKEVSYG